jgi:hypothetical protein
VDRFDNSASNSLIDFINIFRCRLHESRLLCFSPTRRVELCIAFISEGEFPYSSQKARKKEQQASYSRVKFHTIILITSRYSSGMQQVAEEEMLGEKKLLRVAQRGKQAF